MGNKILMAVRGFEEPQKQTVMEKLNAEGAEIEHIVVVHTRIGVLQACTEDPEIQTAVISEYLESGSPYKPEEFDEIDAIREDLRVIPILMDAHHGKKYMEKLYAQAIYHAVFEKHADMAVMAGLIKNGRNKKAAREYYGISGNKAEVAGRTGEYSNPEEIRACFVHVMDGGKQEEFCNRLSYVRKRLSYQDFILLLSKLPEEYLQELREHAEFREYFRTEHPVSHELEPAQQEAPEKQKPERRKPRNKKAAESEGNITIPMPVLPHIRNVNYVEEKKVIGVIGEKRLSGSTMLAVQLAKRLARSEVYHPALIQLPDTEDMLSDYLNGKFRHGSLSFEQFADPKGKIPPEANCLDGVRYIFGRREGQAEKWSYVKTIKMLHTAGTPCILDMGSQYRKYFYLNTLKDCHTVIAVLDGRGKPDLEKIRAIREEVKNSNIGNLIFIINHYEKYKKEFASVFESDEPYFFIPTFEFEKPDLYACMEETCIEEDILDRIIAECGLSMENRKGVRQIERTIVKHRVIPKGTLEIGVCSVSHGTGATCTAILCAHSLSEEYRVAYVEQNDSGHMQCLMEALTETGEEHVTGGIFSFLGVDYYYGMDYLQFASEYKNTYDFVVVDFGIPDTGQTAGEFRRMHRHFVVVPHVLWREKNISDYCEWMEDGNYMESVVYLTPYRSTEHLRRKLNTILGEAEIREVGYASDVFRPEMCHKKLFQELCGVMAEEESVHIFQKWREKRCRRKKGKIVVHAVYHGNSGTDRESASPKFSENFRTGNIVKTALKKAIWIFWHLLLFIFAGVFITLLWNDSTRNTFFGMFSL